MTVTKLLIWGVLCQLSTYTYSLPVSDACDFHNSCQPRTSDWWINRSVLCFRCPSGKKYHCARDYDSPEDFREGCATEKICPAGEEPHLSFLKDGKKISDPEVYCRTCHDEERYNSKQNTSSADYSECPYKKWNICTADKHKILCNKSDDSTAERYCRCDARGGFSPVNDFSYEKCSYKNYDCRDVNTCSDGQQLLLNYTCAAKCDEGFDRLDENTDDCIPLPIVKTTRKAPAVSTPSAAAKNSSTTVPSAKAPEPSTQSPLVCDEKCDVYQICDGGKCVCPDNCTAVNEPVCGYHAESDTHQTFSSKCQLRRSYCQHRKFIYSSDGECKKDFPWIIVIIIGCVFVSLVLVCVIHKSSLGKKVRDKFCRYPEFKPIEMIVEAPTPPKSSVDGSSQNEIGNQPNGRHIDRQISAPLSEHEDVSTPNLSSEARKQQPVIIHKTTNIYHGTVIQKKGGKMQIAIGSSPKSKNKLYNDKDRREGEDDPLLNEKDEAGQDTSWHTVSADVHSQRENLEQTAKPSDCDSKKLVNTGPLSTVDKTSGRNETDLLKNVEADFGETKPVTKQISDRDTPQNAKLGSFYKRQRTVSVSYDSLFLEPDIKDVTEVLPPFNIENLVKESEKYKELVSRVMDKSFQYLLDFMDPVAVLDRFTAKEILTNIIRRDISDMPLQTQKSRAIIKRIRERGKQNYQDFKMCLWETKQAGCLVEVEKNQSEVLKAILCPADNVPEQSQSESLAHSCPKSDQYTDNQDEIPMTNTDEVPNSGESFPGNIPFVSLKQGKTSLSSDQASPGGHVCANNSREAEFHTYPKEKINFRQDEKGPKFVPPEEPSLEETAHKYLDDLKDVLTKFSRGRPVSTDTDKAYKIFKRMCKEIREQLLEFTSKTLVPGQLTDCLQFLEEYRNTPEGFQAYKSSGKENSCLYQSISLLLTGTEDLQYRLRLLATLHAVESYRIYKKLLVNYDVETLKHFFSNLINDSTSQIIQAMNDAEAIIDVCLQTLIMETACLGTDSSVLHVGFLCGALGMNIHQHFQVHFHYGAEMETIPWEKIIQGDWVNPDVPDLHIFWVDYNKKEQGAMNHIVPLLRTDVTTKLES